MKNFLKFNVMITPKLVVALFWLGSIGMIVGYGVASWQRYKAYSWMELGDVGGTFGGIIFPNRLIDIAVLLLSIVILRIICELMIVIFKINSNLQKISQTQSAPQNIQNVEPNNI